MLQINSSPYHAYIRIHVPTNHWQTAQIFITLINKTANACGNKIPTLTQLGSIDVVIN